MNKFVQFDGPDETTVVSVFGCLQDPEFWSNQGEVADDDPRYLAFTAAIDWPPHQILGPPQ